MESWLLYLFMFSSFSVKYNEVDSSLAYRNNEQGEVVLYSRNSAERLNITRRKVKGDTLFVSYRRGPRVRIDNVLPLSDPIKYVVCAGNVYQVEQNEHGFQMTKSEAYVSKTTE